MEREDCDIPTSVKVLGWGVIGLVSLYFCKEFLEYPDFKSFLEKQGSLIAGIIAFVAAVLALYSQRESVQTQIDSQKKIEKNRVFKEKIEEAYNAANNLRLKILLTKSKDIKDSTKDIDIFNYDIDKVDMLCQLYEIVSSEIADNYREIATDFLNTWGEYTEKRLTSDGVSKEDADKVVKAICDLSKITDKLIEELILVARKL